MEQAISVSLPGGTKVEATIRGFTITTDQPEADGGTNAAPSPFELFLASIAACAGYFVASFCRARSIATENIRLRQTVFRNDATHFVERIDIAILLPPDFPVKYKEAVVRAAESCTVKKHLAAPPVVAVSAVTAGE
jgi:putative redox protein